MLKQVDKALALWRERSLSAISMPDCATNGLAHQVAGRSPYILRHKRDLVVGVEQRVGVAAGPGAGIAIDQLGDADRRGLVVDCAEVDGSALVDLHWDLLASPADSARPPAAAAARLPAPAARRR